MKVYLAGAIFGQSDADCKDWRKTSTDVLAAANIETLDPMRRDFRGKELENKDEIVDTDLDDIGNCDAVLVRADLASWGTAMELVYAYLDSKFIVAWGIGEKVSPWLVYHTDVQVRTLEGALKILVERNQAVVSHQEDSCSNGCTCKEQQ